MKGTITKLDNQWMVRYDTFQNDHSYPLPAYNFIPLHPEYQTILPLDLDLNGKEVEFDWCVIVDHDSGKGKEYAKLSGSEVRKQTLAFLASQAQELSMGYEPEWDNFFQESEKVLNFELPLRYKNWLRNTYQKPQKNEK